MSRNHTLHARVVRETRKADAAVLLREARIEAGLSVAAFAAAAGVSPTLVRMWEDQEDFDHPVPADALMVAEIRVYAIRRLAIQEGLVVHEMGADSDRDLGEQIARDLTEPIRELAAATADGYIDPAERERLTRAGWDALEACHRLVREMAALTAKERAERAEAKIVALRGPGAA